MCLCAGNISGLEGGKHSPMFFPEQLGRNKQRGRTFKNPQSDSYFLEGFIYAPPLVSFISQQVLMFEAGGCVSHPPT